MTFRPRMQAETRALGAFETLRWRGWLSLVADLWRAAATAASAPPRIPAPCSSSTSRPHRRSCAPSRRGGRSPGSPRSTSRPTPHSGARPHRTLLASRPPPRGRPAGAALTRRRRRTRTRCSSATTAAPRDRGAYRGRDAAPSRADGRWTAVGPARRTVRAAGQPARRRTVWPAACAKSARAYGDNSKLYEMDAVTLLCASASCAFDHGAELSLTAADLTDKAYVANCASFGCCHGQGRTVLTNRPHRW